MNKFKILIIFLLIIIGYLLYKDHKGMENFAEETNSSTMQSMPSMPTESSVPSTTSSESSSQETMSTMSTMSTSSESTQESVPTMVGSESMQEAAPIMVSPEPMQEVMPETLQETQHIIAEKPVIKDKLQQLDGYKLCLGNTCITENDLKSFIKHGDKFTLKTNMNNNRLRITDPAKNNEPRQAWFSNSNRGPWEVMRIEKCGLDGIEDGNKCWSWGAFGKQVDEPDI